MAISCLSILPSLLMCLLSGDIGARQSDVVFVAQLTPNASQNGADKSSPSEKAGTPKSASTSGEDKPHVTEAKNAVGASSEQVKRGPRDAVDLNRVADEEVGTPAKAASESKIATTNVKEATRRASEAAEKAEMATKTIAEKKPGLNGIEVLILAIVLIGFLGFMFWLLFHLMHKWDQSSYLGELYKDTINDIEYKRLRSAIAGNDYYQDVLDDAEWMTNNPPPEHMQLFRGRGTGTGTGLGPIGPGADWGTGTGSGGPPGGTSAEDARIKYFEKLETERKEVDAWNRKVDTEILRRQTIDVEKARKTAKERTTNALNIDWNIMRGRGPEFILEFSAILVIIFAALISATLGVLDSQQIGTLLAAIAGYVLGRSANRAQSRGSEPAPVSPATTAPTSSHPAPAAAIAASPAPANQAGGK